MPENRQIDALLRKCLQEAMEREPEMKGALVRRFAALLPGTAIAGIRLDLKAEFILEDDQIVNEIRPSSTGSSIVVSHLFPTNLPRTPSLPAIAAEEGSVDA